ncbi:MAG: sulfur carrier protein [Planctomycetota bacterium]|jgi:sulfur carrier protein
MPLVIKVNGVEREVELGSTVADLVSAEGLAPNQVAVELNQVLVPRAARAERVLESGDGVELVTMVGGG